MGIIGCQVDNNFEKKEIMEELKMKDDYESLKKKYYEQMNYLKKNLNINV